MGAVGPLGAASGRLRRLFQGIGVVPDPFTLMEIYTVASMVACGKADPSSLEGIIRKYLMKWGVDADPEELSRRIVEVVGCGSA